jgi:uncharacterized FAD-dependent dehydrogenase
LPAAVAAHLRLPRHAVKRLRILRKSLDARSRHDLQFVYSAELDLEDGVRFRSERARCDISPYSPESFDDPPAGDRPLAHRPVIVGAGPAGLLAAYYLARRGYSPLILERGQAVKERVPAIRAFDAGGLRRQAHLPDDGPRRRLGPAIVRRLRRPRIARV